MLPLERAQMANTTTSWYKTPGMIDDLRPRSKIDEDRRGFVQFSM